MFIYFICRLIILITVFNLYYYTFCIMYYIISFILYLTIFSVKFKIKYRDS